MVSKFLNKIFRFIFCYQNFVLSATCFSVAFISSIIFVSSLAFGLELKPNDIKLPQNISKKSQKNILLIFNNLEKKHNNSSPTLWVLKYKKSLLFKRKNKDIFCAGMRDLSDSSVFPLHKLALIHFYESCSSPTSLAFDLGDFPPWLHLRAAKAFYNSAHQLKNYNVLFEAAQYLGDHLISKDDRIYYLKLALSYAKKIDNTPSNKNKIETTRSNLYKQAPYLHPKPEFKNYLSIAHSYRKKRQFKPAIQFYRKVLNSSEVNFEQKHQSFKWLIWIYKNQKNQKKHIVASKQWSRWLLDINSKKSLYYYYQNELNIAQKYWNYNRNKEAIAIIDKILKDPASSVVSSRAYWLRGLIYEEERTFNSSLKDWGKAIRSLQKNKKNPDLLEKILWKKAWLLRKQKKYTQSLNALHQLKIVTKNPYTKNKIIFWIGETHRELNYKFLAKKSYMQLVKKDIFGYYGLISRYRLGQDLKIKMSSTDLNNIEFIDKDNSKNIVHWLLFLNERQLLSQFLQSKQNNLTKSKNKTKQEWMQLISFYLLSKDYIKAFQSLEHMNLETKKYFLTEHINFLFPLDYQQEVKKISKKYQLPQALIFSLIRQESAFNPKARSLADAFGLMQLIPSTARETSRRLGIKYRGFRHLYNPKKNILLGTSYLKRLLNKYDQNFILSVAAYNAGGTPVNRWLNELHPTTAFEFIESIPYEETRTYVRLLIRNYIFYHNLLQEDNKDYPIEWILKKPLAK